MIFSSPITCPPETTGSVSYTVYSGGTTSTTETTFVASSDCSCSAGCSRCADSHEYVLTVLMPVEGYEVPVLPKTKHDSYKGHRAGHPRKVRSWNKIHKPFGGYGFFRG